jgi:hypothetical protein
MDIEGTIRRLGTLITSGVLASTPGKGAARASTLYWSTESIYNMGQMWGATQTALTGTVAPVSSLTATYGGNRIGMTLLHLADETQAFVNGAWVSQARPAPLEQYCGLILQSGRNDAGFTTNRAAFADALDKAISQGLKFFPRMVLANCVPQANAGLTGWDATDPITVQNYQTVFTAAASKWGVPFLNDWQRFQDEVTAGTYTVGQLMRDIYHPTTSTGAAELAASVAAALNAYVGPSSVATPTIGGRVVNYLFGQPTAGTWVMVTGASAVGPTNSPVANVTPLADQVPSASGAGAKLVFPSSKAKQVWVHWLNRGTGGGTFAAYVDRGTENEKTVTVDTTNAALPNYPQTALIGNAALGAGAHTIELETTSASPVAILGVTCVGAD